MDELLPTGTTPKQVMAVAAKMAARFSSSSEHERMDVVSQKMEREVSEVDPHQGLACLEKTV